MERLPETIDAEPVDGESSLRQEVEDLQDQVESLRTDFRQLAMLIKSARIVYGNASGSAPAATNPDADKWERIRAKVGGKMAEIIEALQLCGTANRTQLKKQTGGAMGTIDQAVYKLRDMGYVVKSGDGWSLKP